VGDAAGEPPYGLELLGLAELLFAALERLLRPLSRSGLGLELLPGLLEIRGALDDARLELELHRAEATIRLLDLLRAAHHLRLRLAGAREKLLRDLALLRSALGEAHEFGDVLGAMNDVDELAVLIDHRRIDGAPISLFEAASGARRATHVVLLHRHRVGLTRRENALERRAQIGRSGGARVVRIVGKDVEQVTTDDRGALRHRRAQIRIARGHDDELGTEHQVEPGSRLEQPAKIRGLAHRGRYSNARTKGRARAILQSSRRARPRAAPECGQRVGQSGHSADHLRQRSENLFDYVRRPARADLAGTYGQHSIQECILGRGGLEPRERVKIRTCVITYTREGHVDERAVVGLEGDPEIELERAVRRLDRPICAAREHFSADAFSFERASHDRKRQALAERRRAEVPEEGRCRGAGGGAVAFSSSVLWCQESQRGSNAPRSRSP